MSRPLARLRPSAAVTATVLGLALTLTGCGTGHNAQTSKAPTNIDGINATVGSVDVRNARIVLGPDGPSLALTVINAGPEPDVFSGATSSAAAAVTLFGADGQPSAGLQLPVGTPVTAGQGGAVIRLTPAGLPMRVGGLYPVTLSFDKSGQATLQIPAVAEGQ